MNKNFSNRLKKCFGANDQEYLYVVRFNSERINASLSLFDVTNRYLNEDVNSKITMALIVGALGSDTMNIKFASGQPRSDIDRNGDWELWTDGELDRSVIEKLYSSGFVDEIRRMTPDMDDMTKYEDLELVR